MPIAWREELVFEENREWMGRNNRCIDTPASLLRNQTERMHLRQKLRPPHLASEFSTEALRTPLALTITSAAHHQPLSRASTLMLVVERVSPLYQLLFGVFGKKSRIFRGGGVHATGSMKGALLYGALSLGWRLRGEETPRARAEISLLPTRWI